MTFPLRIHVMIAIAMWITTGLAFASDAYLLQIYAGIIGAVLTLAYTIFLVGARIVAPEIFEPRRVAGR